LRYEAETAAIAQLKRDNAECQARITELTEGQEVLRQEKEKLESQTLSDISQMNAKCHSLSEEVRSQKHKLGQARHEMNELSRHTTLVEAENQSLRQELATAREEAKQLKYSLAQTVESLLYARQDAKDKDKIIGQMTTAEQMTATQESELQSQVDQCRSELSQAEMAVREKEIQSRTAQHQLGRKESEVSTLEGRVNILAGKPDKQRKKESNSC
jgi:chromosome segregation ATPase